MEYVGSSITIRVDTDRNGTWEHQYSTTTTAIYSGLCAIGAFNPCYADDFCCGDDCAYESVPVSNWAIVLAVVLIGGFIALRRFRLV
jgi:hypothetical protein